MIRNASLLCGVISSVLYVLTIDVVAAVMYPEYHRYTSQMVSELMAREAPTRALMAWEGMAYNGLVLIFGTSVLLSSRGGRALRLTGASLLGYGLASTVGGFITPMDMREAGLTPQTWLHIGTTALQGVFMVAVLGFGAFVHEAKFRWYSLGTLIVALVFGLLAGIQAGQESVRWIGLTERISIYAWMIWIAVFALSLWRPVNLAASTKPHLPAAGSSPASSRGGHR